MSHEIGPEPRYRYSAFISHRHVGPDQALAQRLHRRLETYRVPRQVQREPGAPARLGRVFGNEEELAASSSLSQAIEQALRESRYLIVLCSPRTLSSQWVAREIERFREMGRDERILTVLIEGEPRDSFPPPCRGSR